MDLMHHYQQHLQPSSDLHDKNIPQPIITKPPKEQILVPVKYRGKVDLALFDCMTISHSSLVKRLCYYSKEKHVIVNLKGTYYPYCKVPASVVGDWLAADSMGKFFDAYIKHNFGCSRFRDNTHAK